MYSYSGMKVNIVSPVIVPNFRISDNVSLTLEFRNELNTWCDGFFGVKCSYDVLGDAKIIAHSNQLFMSRETYDILVSNMELGTNKDI